MMPGLHRHNKWPTYKWSSIKYLYFNISSSFLNVVIRTLPSHYDGCESQNLPIWLTPCRVRTSLMPVQWLSSRSSSWRAVTRGSAGEHEQGKSCPKTSLIPTVWAIKTKNSSSSGSFLTSYPCSQQAPNNPGETLQSSRFPMSLHW